MSALTLTAFDYAFLGILALSALLGMWRGLVSELLALVGWGLALFAAWAYSARLGALFVGYLAEPIWRQLAAGLLIVILVLSVLAMVRYLLRQLLRVAGLGSADRLFGSFFGLARGLLISLVLVLMGGVLGLAQQPWWSQAMFAPPLEAAVIAAKPWMPALIADKIHFR